MTVYGCMMANKTFCLTIKIFWSSCSVRKQRPSTSTVYIFKQNKLFDFCISLSFLARFFSHQIKNGFFKFFYVLHSALLHLPPHRFHCAGRCWNRTRTLALAVRRSHQIRMPWTIWCLQYFKLAQVSIWLCSSSQNTNAGLHTACIKCMQFSLKVRWHLFVNASKAFILLTVSLRLSSSSRKPFANRM
jgi:hypothetical protein